MGDLRGTSGVMRGMFRPRLRSFDNRRGLLGR
jgi:hypothetical protein